MGSAEACTSRARLTEVSDSEVCAAVTLGENAEAERYADKTRFTLVSSTGEVDKGSVHPSTVTRMKVATPSTTTETRAPRWLPTVARDRALRRRPTRCTRHRLACSA